MGHVIGHTGHPDEHDIVQAAFDHDEEMRDEYEEPDEDKHTGTPIVCLPCGRESVGECKHITFITVFEVDREYGGPEEGGWYYDTGVPVLVVPVIHPDSEQLWTPEAEAAYDALREQFPRTGKRNSVLGGADYDISARFAPGRAYPARRPHYE